MKKILLITFDENATTPYRAETLETVNYFATQNALKDFLLLYFSHEMKTK